MISDARGFSIIPENTKTVVISMFVFRLLAVLVRKEKPEDY